MSASDRLVLFKYLCLYLCFRQKKECCCKNQEAHDYRNTNHASPVCLFGHTNVGFLPLTLHPEVGGLFASVGLQEGQACRNLGVMSLLHLHQEGGDTVT